MLKKVSAYLFSFVFGCCSSGIAVNSDSLQARCPPELLPVVQSIERLPSAKRLIMEVQRNGPIHLDVNQSPFLSDFEAYWEADKRRIVVNLAAGSNRALSSILFELCNALTHAQFVHYYRLVSEGKIDKESYIHAIELIEYKNALHTSQLISEGIKLGVYPQSSDFPTFASFEEYLHAQQIAGHSDWVGRTYDMVISQRPAHN